MATFTSNTSNGYYLKVVTSVGHQSVTNNTTAVGYSVYLHQASNRFYNSSNSGNVKINGTTVYTVPASFNSTNWDRHTDILLASGTLVIPHNTDGTKTISITGTWKSSGGTYAPSTLTLSGSQTFPTIDRIATITSATDFSDIESPYLTTSNPAFFRIDAQLRVAGNVVVSRTHIPSPFGYNFDLTEAERNALFTLSANTKEIEVEYYLITRNSSGASIGTDSKKRKLVIVDADPIFNNWTYKDTNATTVALTGNNQKIIKGVSDVEATISSANKMVAQKQATPVGYTFTIGTKTANIPYSASTVTSTLTAVDNIQMDMVATDSRGFTKTVSKNLGVNLIEYVKPVMLSATAIRTNNIDSETTLKFNGNFWNSSFGTTTNSITARCRFKLSSASEYSEWVNLTTTVSDNTFNFEGIINGDLGAVGFSRENAFHIQVEIKDKLTTLHSIATLIRGAPTLAIHSDGISLQAPYDESLGGALQINGKSLLDVFYPVGTIYETTSTDLDTTTKMDNYFGGTWETYGAGRVLVAKSSETEFDTIGKTSGAKTHTLTEFELPTWVWTAYDSTGSGAINTLFSTGSSYKMSTGGTGKNQPHNNLQPYIVVYRYRRIT